MSYLYLDIETIPSQNSSVRKRIAKKIKPPANIKKEESGTAWWNEKAPAVINEAVAKTSFDGGLGHVCCICSNDSETNISRTHKINDDLKLERKSLVLFAESLREYNSPPVIVGHNINNFDIRFLWQRAMCLGVKFPGWFPKDPKPWGHDTFDTMTAWAGQRGTISLDDLAFNLGLEGKGDVDGSMVAQMWLDGKHQEIAEYCMDDVLLVKKIHEKMMIAGM